MREALRRIVHWSGLIIEAGQAEIRSGEPLQPCFTSLPPNQTLRGTSLTYLAILLITLGASARVHAYLANRNLWLDEAMLALNVATRTFVELTHPLDHSQLAPWGFLFISKASVLAFGMDERALRLVPLLAGLAALPLMYYLAKLCLGNYGAALLATTLFAVSPVAVYQSTEFKPYSTDGLWTLLILCVAIPSLRAEPTARRLLALAAVGVLAVWSSYPSVFILAAVCAVLVVRVFRSSHRGSVLASMSLLAVLGLNSLISYRLATSPSTRDFMRGFWQSAFFPFPPTRFWDVVHSLDVLNGLFATITAPEPFLSVDTGSALLVTGVFLVGFAYFLRADRWTLAVLTMPIGFSLVASALRLYPVGGRVSLFVLPALAIVMSAGLIDEWRSSRQLFAAILTVLLVLFPTLSVLNTLGRPQMRDEIRPVLGHMSKNWRGGDVIFVNGLAEPAFTFYTMFGDVYPWTLDSAILARTDQHKLERYMREFDTLHGRPRVWVLFSHTAVQPKEERLYVGCLDGIGRRLDEFRAVGASVYLYDFSTTSTGAPCIVD